LFLTAASFIRQLFIFLLYSTHPTLAIGICLRVLYALQLDEDILWLAKKDKMGRALQDLNLKNREHASKKE
jgi:hypothetical protein